MPRLLRDWIHLLLPEGRKPRKILLRVDAGRKRGLSFGHLSRCLVLAKGFEDTCGAEVVFVMRDYPEGVAYARESGVRVEVIARDSGPGDDALLTAEAVRRASADVLVIDLPYDDLDFSLLAGLREDGIWVVFVDDARFINPGADVVLNSSILAPQKTPRPDSTVTRYLLGAEYFIFEGPGRRHARELKGDLRVLISFGGSDPAGLTAKTLRTISQRPWPGVSFTVVLGPGYAHAGLVAEILGAPQQDIGVADSPEDIYRFFLESDLVICAGGRTLYELHALGVPAMAVASIGHEAPVIRAFVNNGLLLDGLDCWDDEEFTDRLDGVINHINETKRA